MASTSAYNPADFNDCPFRFESINCENYNKCHGSNDGDAIVA